MYKGGSQDRYFWFIFSYSFVFLVLILYDPISVALVVTKI